MQQSILLITGWGGGEKLLNPLKQSLEQHGCCVELSNIFNALNEQILMQEVERATQFDVIAGWSLGGELATVLAHEVAKQTGQNKLLITLASNPSFVTHEGWPDAMSVEHFDQFKQSFENDPITTLKRFGLLVTKGVSTAKSDFNTMQTMLQAQPRSILKQGLEMLGQFNLVDILKNYAGRQLHLFAEYDALVPYQIVQNMRLIQAKNIKVVEVEGAAHSFPFVQVERTCKEITEMINSAC